MKRVASIFLLLFFADAIAQEKIKTEFEKYGPYGSTAFTDLKIALKEEKSVYKLNLSYQPVDLKLWAKLPTLKDLQALHLQSISVNQWQPDFSNLVNLVYLASYNNEFTGFPKDFKKMGNLMYLEFHNCKIDSIPQDIAYLQRLKTFKFGGSGDTLRLPKSIKYLKSLNELVLESVVLDSFPKPLFAIAPLKKLILINCSIYTLPQSLEKLPNLEILALDYNKISTLPRDIYKCKNLYILSLRKNNISKIPDTICQLKNLTKLDLRENPISPDDVEELRILLPGCQIYY
ncbi:MAG TPA: hypothetical protein VF411_00990 [Bacteroidia bacterium]